MQASLSLASGSGTSPMSRMRARSHGSIANSMCTRRAIADTLRTARGPRCWSRSVVPLPVECGTPTRAMSQLLRVTFHGAAKERGDVPPVQALQHELVGARQTGRSHLQSPFRQGKSPDGLGPMLLKRTSRAETLFRRMRTSDAASDERNLAQGPAPFLPGAGIAPHSSRLGLISLRSGTPRAPPGRVAPRTVGSRRDERYANFAIMGRAKPKPLPLGGFSRETCPSIHRLHGLIESGATTPGEEGCLDRSLSTNTRPGKESRPYWK